MPPSDCTTVVDMDGPPTGDVWVGVEGSGGAVVVRAAGSVVGFNGVVASCRRARLAKNIRIRVLLI